MTASAVSQRVVACLDARGRGVLTEQPTPDLTPGCVRLRVTATMVSPGTQLNGVAAMRQGEKAGPDPAQPLGYQAAGVVVEVGAGVTRLSPGQRVACMGPGALHTDVAVVPQNLCAVIPDNVTDDEASGVNLVLTALQAIRRTPCQLGEFALIVGLGAVGQLTGQFARSSGLYVMGWDMSAGRLETAKGLAADAVANPRDEAMLEQCKAFTAGLGFDAAILAIGGDGTPALEQVKTVMKVTPDGHAMGHITLVGGLTTTSQWGAGMGNLDLHSSARSGPGYHDDAWEIGQTAYPQVFVRWTTQTNMQLALRMIADGRLRVDPLITHRLPLDAIDDAIASLVEQPDKTLAVVLKP